jgi:thiosulfate/3-mercaptopyruvate sulfurtransferase
MDSRAQGAYTRSIFEEGRISKLTNINRRRFLLASAAYSLLSARMKGDETMSDPWSRSELIEPADFVKWLRAERRPFRTICVTFPALYRQKHIPHAQFAGPTNKPEGVAALRSAVQGLPRNEEIVIYCGCCPMKNCPNIRPAYRVLKELGFERLGVIDLPTNFHTDWVAKGYPSET